MTGKRLLGLLALLGALLFALMGGEYSTPQWRELRRSEVAERATVAQLRREVDSLARMKRRMLHRRCFFPDGLAEIGQHPCGVITHSHRDVNRRQNGGSDPIRFSCEGIALGQQRGRQSRVIINDVRIANVPGGKRRHFATVKQIIITGGIDSFWGRKIRVGRIDLIQPRMSFEVFAPGGPAVGVSES